MSGHEAEDPRLVLVLAMADDELILGHRHSEWTGWAPHIEEDLAFSSIAQDEMAHARLLYRLARDAGLTERVEDTLALGREPFEYTNAVLCERPNGEWGYSVARQYLYDTADAVRLDALARSTWQELADAVKVIQLEEKYHLDHARVWFERLTTGPSLTAREKFAEGLGRAIGEAIELFEPLAGEDRLVADGVMARTNEAMLSDWLARLGQELEGVSMDYVLERHAGSVGEMVPTSSGEIPGRAEDLSPPVAVRRDGRWVHEGGFTGAGGRRGRHSEDFLPLWEEMTALYREYPGASW
jgi:ring-1,2-phenylacetyl-CoA epoxidase subunit PaaC